MFGALKPGFRILATVKLVVNVVAGIKNSGNKLSVILIYLLFIYLMLTVLKRVKKITKGNNMPLTGDSSTIPVLRSTQITVQIPNY